MSIEDEKARVRELRSEGLTVHQIAARVQKSAFWVYSRLNDRYAPKRKRETAEIPPEEITEVPRDPHLFAEMKELRALRKSGMTYQAIADQFGRSIYWVHSRLKGKYQPTGARAERRFQEEVVVPFLVGCGHRIVAECARTDYDGFVLEADVTSTLAGETWLTEVKVDVKGHQLHTAIGQLVLHRSLRDEDPNLHLQIALPTDARQPRLHQALVESLVERERISVVFLEWPS